MQLVFRLPLCLILMSVAAADLEASYSPQSARDLVGPHSMPHSSDLSRYVKLADADVLPAEASKELSILYYLAMARGHLLASIELSRSSMLDQSVLHSRHTLDEAWIELARFLPMQQTQALRNRLDAMNEAVALKLTQQQIEGVHQDASLYLVELTEASFASDRPRVNQKLELIGLLLEQAYAEYEEAWQDFELQDAAEYQDGYAFLAVANAELQSIYPDLEARNPKATAEIRKTIERLTGAWPSPQPPERPLMSKPLLRALVNAVAINARQLSH
jgi:hypothetical protein